MVTTNLHLGNCLDVMAALPRGSIDMVFADLPYGVTACSWDAVIPFDKLWAAYAHVVKPRGAIVLTATQPFTSALVMSNPKWFRHEWIWDKVSCGAGFQLAKYRPMQRHEHILVFGQESPAYYPVLEKYGVPIVAAVGSPSAVSPLAHSDGKRREYFYKQPQSILTGDVVPVPKVKGSNYHPSEKPVPLLAYLIQTYSRRGDTVLDNTMGSGSTGVACINEGRHFVGIEMDLEYFDTASQRIMEEKASRRIEVGFVFGTDSEGLLISQIVPEDKRQPTIF